MKRPRLGWSLAGLVALLLLVGAGLVARSTQQAVLEALHPKRRAATPAENGRAFALLPGVHEVSLRTSDGLTLGAWYAPGRRPAVVVLVHGLGANRARLLPEAHLLWQRGLGVLLYDSRASGKSDGELATWGDLERRDVTAALDFALAQPGIREAGLYGFAQGASAVALTDDPRVAAVALGALWPTLTDELDHRFNQWGPLSHAVARASARAAGLHLDAVRPIDAFPRLAQKPLFLMSGEDDQETPLEIMDQLAALAPTAQRWTAAGVGHGNFADVEQFNLDAHFGTFFDRVLAKEAAAAAPGPVGVPGPGTESAPGTPPAPVTP